MNLFKPYEGEKPYIFVSYAHNDSEEVIPVLNKLHDLGFRVWYDEGLELGCIWTESVASHLKDSELMIGFISDAYINSENCKREMSYAVGMNKKIINVFLSETEMSPGMELQIGGIWALMKHNFDDEKFMQKLLEAPMLYSADLGATAPEALLKSKASNLGETGSDSVETVKEDYFSDKTDKKKKSRNEKKKAADNKNKPKWKKIVSLSVLALLLIAALVLIIVGHYTGFNQRFIKKSFPQKNVVQQFDSDFKPNIENEMLRNIAAEYADKPFGEVTVGDLRGLRELYIFGDKFSFKDEFGEIKITEDETSASASLGASYVTDVSRGSIYNLDELKYFTDLKKLQICFQNIKTLTYLESSGIETFDIRYNKLENLNGIGNLAELRVLRADNNNLANISDLGALSNLEELYIVNNHVSNFEAVKTLPNLKKFSVSGINTESLRPVFYPDSLEELTLTNCKLSEDFFDRIDMPGLVKLKLFDCNINGFDKIERTNIVEMWLLDPSGKIDADMLSEVKSLAFLYLDEETAKNFNKNTEFKIIVYKQ